MGPSYVAMANGGLGIRRATDIALPAYLSSVSGSHLLITHLLLQRLHLLSGTNDSTIIDVVSQWSTRVNSSQVKQPFASSEKVWDEPLVRVL